MKTESHKSSTGMDANVFAMLVYIISIILGWIPYVYYAAWVFPMLVILVIEKDSIFVKRHAAQAMALYIVVAALHIIFDIISAAIVISLYSNPFSFFGAAGGALAISVISGIIGVLIMVAAIFGAVKAYQYEDYSIPLIGGFGDKLAEKLNVK